MRKLNKLFFVLGICLFVFKSSFSQINGIMGLNSNLFHYSSSNFYSNTILGVGVEIENRFRFFGQVGYTKMLDFKHNIGSELELNYWNFMMEAQSRFFDVDRKLAPLAALSVGWPGKPTNPDVWITDGYRVLKTGNESGLGVFNKIHFFVEPKLLLDLKIGKFIFQTGAGYRFNFLSYTTIWQINNTLKHSQTKGFTGHFGLQYVIPMKRE